MTGQEEYPRFISNRPCGNDKYEGKSQERLAKAIAKHFKDTDSKDSKICLPRIVGLEGIWGSGKSNVIRLLEKELAGEYYFFEYDAWGHQEDLQRRSFLELLTSQLITDEVLSGDTTIKIKGGGSKRVSWNEKLKYLLARKTETVTEKYPRISNGMAAAFLVAILTPIFTFIAYAIKPSEVTWWYVLLSIFISALPVIVALIIWLNAYRKDNKKYNLSYLLAIYKDKIENDVCYETLSEDEPTVTEFKAWMQDISDFIEVHKKKRIVVIFDNMDRLPADKVKELWSSIHTFFSEDGFPNIWAIIPFDEKHLACAFGDGEDAKIKQLTSYFINKTFPIVYRVAQPVITDFRKIFNSFFQEAFGDTDEDIEKDTINRIYRLLHPNANVREIISFINEIVTLKSVWGEDITILNIALFVLNKDILTKDPVNQILSGNYLSGVSKIIKNDMVLQRQISALVYGIDIEHARQIPLTKYIENCVAAEYGYDINEYSESNKQFDTVLDEVIRNIDDTAIDNAINCLYDLKRTNNIINRIWNYLSNRKIESKLQEQKLDDVHKKILLKTGKAQHQKIVNYIYSELHNFKEFSGSNYFMALDDLNNFIKENGLEVSIKHSEKTLSSEVFIDYVTAAGEKYIEYKVKTNPEELDNYFTGLLPDKLDNVNILNILNKSDYYIFNKLYSSIEELIENNEITEENFANIYSAYKILSKDTPLAKQLNTSKAQSIISNLSTKISNGSYPVGYSDIVAMNIASGRNISDYDSNIVTEVANNIEYYTTQGELLENCINWNIPILDEVLHYMVVNKLGQHLELTSIIPIFEQIRTKINVTEDELLAHLSEWTFIENEITKENIKKIVPSSTFWAYTAIIKNDLTIFLNRRIVQALSEVSETTLYNNRNNYNSDYWFTVIKHLISTEYIAVLPENIDCFGKHIMRDIALGNQSLPLPEIHRNIINKLDKHNTKATIKNIKNDFCNGIATMDKSKFLFFIDWFKLQGDMITERAGSVADKIIKPIITDTDCRNQILSDMNFYIQIINQDKEESNDLIKIIETIVLKSEDTHLIEFAKKIGIKKKE